MEKVFTTAGWVQVDANVKDTLLHGLLESISKESYLTMPMSPLYLFGRQQDYGWAHAEPISVVASRNHLRIWKAPFEIEWPNALGRRRHPRRRLRKRSAQQRPHPQNRSQRRPRARLRRKNARLDGPRRGNHSHPSQESHARRQDRHWRQLPLERPSPRPETRRVFSEAMSLCDRKVLGLRHSVTTR